MSDLEPCPFCGSEAESYLDENNLCRCPKQNCYLYKWIPVCAWNTRPIEDKLQAELDTVRTLGNRARTDADRLQAELEQAEQQWADAEKRLNISLKEIDRLKEYIEFIKKDPEK